MKYLKIQNQGLLDIRLVALMGGTTKANDEYKIGQFGTGLKYTLAYLIRNNIDFKIFVGTEEIKVETVTETIKETDFSIICINGHRTSITDKMGMEWKAWMIVRELWCNALDEGGQNKEVTESVTGAKNTTTFYIQLTNEIKEVVDGWNNYFVHDIEPLSSDFAHAIYSGGDKLRLYKNGVLIKELNEKSLYSYDLKYAHINELREFNGSASGLIYDCLSRANQTVIQNFLESVTESHYEGKDMDWNWYSSLGENWKKALEGVKIIHPKAIQTIKDRGLDIDTDGMVIVPEVVYKALTKQFQGIGALRTSKKVNEFYETYSSAADAKVKQALVILEEAEYNFSPELKFVFGVFGDKGVWAQVNMDEKEVLISENIADKSLFEVCSALIEENEHFKTGFNDHTREFQTHFINLFTQKLLRNEEIEL